MNKEIKLKLVPTQEVLSELSHEVNDPEGHYTMAKLANLAKAVMRDLNLWVIPNFESFDGDVLANSTIVMPSDCVRPILVYKIKPFNGKLVMYQYGKKSSLKPLRPYKCLEDDIPGTITPLRDLLGGDVEYFIYQPAYGEDYGRRDSLFWGYWTYWADDNFVELTGVNEGDRFFIMYQTSNESYSHMPVDAVSMVKNKVLGMFWGASDLNKSIRYDNLFRRDLKMFHKFRTDASIDDWINAFVSEWSPTNR